MATMGSTGRSPQWLVAHGFASATDANPRSSQVFQVHIILGSNHRSECAATVNRTAC